MVLVGLALLLAPARAEAGKADDESKQKARLEYNEATKHYNLGEYGKALERFREAYRAFPDSSLLFNIAQCQRMLDQKVDALRSYRAYLRDARSGRAEVEQVVSSLERAIAEEQAAKAKTPTGTMGDPTSPAPTTTTTPTPSGEPPRIATTTAPNVDATPSAKSIEKQPLHKKGWFWGVVVGAVVVVGVGVGVGLGLRAAGAPSSHFGTAAVFTLRY